MQTTEMQTTRLRFSKLETNLIDMIKEEQIKLGYREETVRLYYPASLSEPSVGDRL